MDVKITLPLLPLRDIVVFPSMVIPLFVGRDKSISALNEVMKKDKKIILVTQKNSEIDDPKKTDIFMYGCEGSILQLLKLPDGTVKVLVEGIKRVKILDFKDNEKFITCEYAHYNDVVTKDEDLYPLAATALRRLEKLTSINKKVSSETINTIKQLKDPSQIADNIASHINATISEKQQIFETVDVKKRLNAIIKIMENETSIIGVEKRIRGRVKTQMEKTQREYYLNEQLKAIQKELGEIEDGKDETTSLNKAIIKSKMPKEVEKKCLQELKKLKNMSPMSAEATVVRNYLDWMTELPWSKKSKINTDLNNAQKILDESITKVYCQEAPLYSKHLGVAGRVDCVGQWNGVDSIIDYKTGAAPGVSQLKSGFAPQLTLEAVIASMGGFLSIEPTQVNELSYWKLSGGEIAGKITNFNGTKKRDAVDPMELADKAYEGLTKLVTTFDLLQTPYLNKPNLVYNGYGEYDHLARTKEWGDD